MNARSISFLSICLFIVNLLFAQIHEVELNPDGVVVPRMDHTTIASPVAGQLVYDINTNSFWFHNGSDWNELGGIFEKNGNTVRQSAGYNTDNFLFGSPQIEYDGDIKHNTRMFYNKQKRAFRVGSTRDTTFFNLQLSGSSTVWDPDQLGYYSFASGLGNEASGESSFAMGEVSKASGRYSMAMGWGSEAIGRASISMGFQTDANGFASTALGRGTIANGETSTVIGRWSADIDMVQSGVADTTRLFIIGNGDNASSRSNAMVVQKNGKVGIGLNSPAELLDVNGSARIQGKLNVGPGIGSNELNLFDIGEDGDVVLRAKTAGGSKEMVMGLNSTGGLFGTVTGTDLRFRTSNIHRMAITSTGDVGINTTGPTAKLDVNGTTLLRSSLTTNGVAGFKEKVNLGPGSGSNELNIFDIGANDDAIIRAKASGGAELVLGASSSGGLFGTASNDILNFRTNNTNKMSITSTGDVGIGDSSPEEKLDVHGNLILDRGASTSGLTRSLKIQGARNSAGSSFARIDFRNIDDDGSNIEYTGARILSQNYTGSNSGNLEISIRDGMVGSPLTMMRIESFNVEVQGTLEPLQSGLGHDLGSSSKKWDDVWANNPIIQTSDFREKTQIIDLSYGLKELMNLRPVSYKWKNKTHEDAHLGLIAQEVQTVIPEVVVHKDFVIDSESGEISIEELDRLGMRSTELIPVLIKAVQEQQEIIALMKTEIEYLKDSDGEMQGLQKQIEELKQMLTSSLEQN